MWSTTRRTLVCLGGSPRRFVLFACRSDRAHWQHVDARPGWPRNVRLRLASEPQDHATIAPALGQVGFAEFPYGAAQPAFVSRVHVDGRDYDEPLYLLPPSHEYVRGSLAFRDYMRRHPDEIKPYAAVKKAAIAEG